MEWLGDIPGYWETRRIKGLAKPGYGTFGDGDWIESPYITARGILRRSYFVGQSEGDVKVDSDGLQSPR